MKRCGRTAVVVVSCLLLGACAAGSGAVRGQPVEVELRDFKIVAPDSLPAGTVTFQLQGVGPTMHEFNVARTDLAPDQLPTGPSDILVDADGTPGLDHVGEREGIDIGGRKTLTVALTPGRYVLYCNMEGHARAGMITTLTVTS